MYRRKSITVFRIVRKALIAALLIACATLVTATPTVSAISQNDLNSIVNNTPFYDPTASTETCSSSSAPTGTVNYVAGKNQTAIAQIIIGIAKTDGLGQRGALIGLMAGLDESHLTIYANSKVPVSLLNPAKQAVGHDGKSVGVFQQQPQYTWSTIATGPAALDNKDAVWQLMDPAYSAEAFFGSPRGSKAPDALSKGVQNKTNWQTADPWVVAQEVQQSGTPDGSNYKAYLDSAQAMVNKLWDSSPPVALPVPLSGGTAAASTTAGSANSSVFMVGDSLTVGMEGAGLKDSLVKNSWQPTIVAVQGKGFSWGQDQVTQNAAAVKSASTIVVELGTNNYSSTPTEFNTQLKALYDTIRGINSTAKIYWMNYTASKEPWQTKLVEKTKLLGAFAAQNNITVIDWAGSAAAQYTHDDTGMGIHPERHYADLVALVVQAIGQAGSATGQVSCTTGQSTTSLGVGKGKFTDNTSITFPGVADMLARVQKLADPTSQEFLTGCNQIVNGKQVYCTNWCDHATGLAWGHAHTGFPSAWDHWNSLNSRGQGHPGDRSVPVGALMFYGNGYPGHAVVYLGSNKLMSTDVLNDQSHRIGGIYITDASSIESGPWHMNYLGWTPPIFGG